MPHDLASGAKPAGPCCLVIFGAAGDLTKRLVVPSLYNLACAHLLPEEFAIAGFDLAEQNDEAWHKTLREMTEQFMNGSDSKEAIHEDVWSWLISKMSYTQGDLNNPDSYAKLKSKLEDIDKQNGTKGNYVFYLAIADRFFGTVVQHLGQSGLSKESNGQWRGLLSKSHLDMIWPPPKSWISKF